MRVVRALVGFMILGSMLVPVTWAEQKTTRVDFDEELIEGEFRKSDLLSIQEESAIEVDSLMRFRENFLPELRQTSYLLKRDK